MDDKETKDELKRIYETELKHHTDLPYGWVSLVINDTWDKATQAERSRIRGLVEKTRASLQLPLLPKPNDLSQENTERMKINATLYNFASKLLSSLSAEPKEKKSMTVRLCRTCSIRV